MRSRPNPTEPRFSLRIVRSGPDLAAAERLRYDVFVTELGGDGPLVDHEARRERDRFDPVFDHLLLIDENRAPGDHVVGVYRLLPSDRAAETGGFYSEAEYDLAPLRAGGRRLLELGRSCLHADYRGGTAMMHLWNALADYVARHEIEVLFGVASFHGTDIAALAPSLSYLHHRHLAPPDLRVRSRAFQPMDLQPEATLDRVAAARAVPALIKGYLRLGGVVGEGAYIDHAFNTTDICLVMDTRTVNLRQRDLYLRGRG
ncbi:GNAT family N-acetyltransferase [Mesobaculum littorinae]|uniref:L-ornithine N(alpha)-acyltransferase n=1 Tax=Mesobaculum littorinae TaxID=2486419 RepID=A0A438AMM7_9RHOB|nr:GNAT family N-acetyltransferase [Mesobaculum littorinae]